MSDLNRTEDQAALLWEQSRRQTLLIEPEFQKSFLKFTLLTALGVGAIFYISFEIFLSRLVERGRLLRLAPDHSYFQFIEEQARFMQIIFGITAVISTAFIVFMGLYLSHRVAGPIYRLKTYLKNARIGVDALPLEFRQKDYFKDLSEALNKFIQSSRQQK